MKSFRFPYIIFWGLTLSAIIVGSLLPVEELPKSTSLISDKVQHAGAYALVGFMAIFAGLNFNAKGLLLFGSAIVSVGIEFLQPYSGRHFEVADMVANAGGLLAATLLCFIFWKTKGIIARKNRI